ncbi:hypothetical protein FB567DRAFT_519189 [Paraphoma chrysanthemicola]|uniref:Uncharacterized protein n=1 Tax=Paraphoma chrysanthemicola TaxID=798071 RepID=A0A8K0RC32_9PLEO|nr:hypothetical protein FB567DRAFT_519189 [Paraphoma chrysanthemicola]
MCLLGRQKREDIRAVIITGEASAASVAELAATAVRTTGTKTFRALTDFNHQKSWHTENCSLGSDDPGLLGVFRSSDSNRIPDDEYWAEQKAKEALTPSERTESL